MHAGSGRARAALLALGLASTVAGCTWSSGSTSDGGTAHGAPDAEQVVDSLLAEAENARYDDSQRTALADRTVDYAEYEAAIETALDCMRDAGAGVVTNGTHVVGAKTLIDYTVDIPDDADGLLAETDACYERHAALVDMLWQTGGTEVHDFDRRRDEALTPAMRECLSSHDVRWSESDSMDELLAKAIELLESTQADCIEETGYATWQG